MAADVNPPLAQNVSSRVELVQAIRDMAAEAEDANYHDQVGPLEALAELVEAHGGEIAWFAVPDVVDERVRVFTVVPF